MRKVLILLASVLFYSASLSFADNTTTPNTDAKTKELFTKSQRKGIL